MTRPEPAILEALIARVAAEELLPRFARVGFELKVDDSLVTEADFAAHHRLREELARLWPGIGFLSEEMPAAEQERLLAGGGPLWCLDPLDGTSNFVAGLPFFCVSLALLDRGQPVLGLVHDPVRGETFRAGRGEGAFLNGRRLSLGEAGIPLERAVALVDLKRLSPGLRQALAGAPPCASLRNFGSSALEWAWLAAGRGHLYLHGGQKLWDLAAGTLLLEEAGGRCNTLTGEPVYKATLASRSVVASPYTDLFPLWRDWLDRNQPTGHP